MNKNTETTIRVGQVYRAFQHYYIVMNVGPKTVTMRPMYSGNNLRFDRVIFENAVSNGAWELVQA